MVTTTGDFTVITPFFVLPTKFPYLPIALRQRLLDHDVVPERGHSAWSAPLSKVPEALALFGQPCLV